MTNTTSLSVQATTKLGAPEVKYSLAGNSYTNDGTYPVSTSNYYLHWRVNKFGEQIFEFHKPVKTAKGAAKEKLEPFSPKSFDTVDKDGNSISHDFVAIDGIPLGLNTGFSLSKYGQEIPDEMSNHCETFKMVAATPYGDITIERNKPCSVFAYGPGGWISDEDKKAGKPEPYNQQLAGASLETYGQSNSAFVKFVGEQNEALAKDSSYKYELNSEWAKFKPENSKRKCSECISNGWNKVTFGLDAQGKPNTNTCTGRTEMLFLVTRLAYRSAKGTKWIDVADLDIDSIPGPFVVVMDLSKADRKKIGSSGRSGEVNVDMNSKYNKHIPVAAVPALPYYQRGNRTYPNQCGTQEVPGIGYEEMLAIPTQIWLARYEDKGAAKYIPLFTEAVNNQSVVNTGWDLINFGFDCLKYELATAAGEEASAPYATSEPKLITEAIESPGTITAVTNVELTIPTLITASNDIDPAVLAAAAFTKKSTSGTPIVNFN